VSQNGGAPEIVTLKMRVAWIDGMGMARDHLDRGLRSTSVLCDLERELAKRPLPAGGDGHGRSELL